MPASAICEVQDGAGSFTVPVDGLNVTPGNTISIRLQSTTDVIQWTLQIFGVDEVTATPPTLTNVNGTTHVVTSPSSVVTFTMPSGVGVARALIFRSSVNGGGSGFTKSFGVYTLTASGKRVGAVGERFEGDADFGWATTVNSIIRSLGGGGSLPPLALQQYAVLMENPAGNLVFARLTQEMILPAFSIASFAKTAPNGAQTLYRRGDTLTGVAAAATYVSGPPTSASISNSFGGSTNGGDINPGSWTINSPFSTGNLAGSIKRSGSDLGADPTWTITLSATKTTMIQSNINVQWTRDVYYGVGAAGLSTEVDIEGLAGTNLQTGRARTITVSPSSEKVYYAYPKSYGLATFTLNGFPAAFNSPAELSLTNSNSVTSTYYVYESTNLLTGSNLNFVVT